MKTKIFLMASLFLLTIACTDENTVESEVTTSAQSLLDTIEQEDGGVYPISKAEMLTLEQELNQSRFLSSLNNCQQETITVYWNGAAETDFVLRQEWRDTFIRDFGLTAAIYSFPETVEDDSEVWIFNYDPDDPGNPCLGPGAAAAVNDNGDEEVNTTDD